jgi:tRNA-dihydrouridine synthase B
MLDNAAHFTEGGARLQPIRLGGLTLESPVVLAPMSGVTDRPFRRIVRKFGAELVVTEMLASKSVVREHRKTLRMAEREADEGLLAVQLAGRDPEIMAEAARLNEDRGADIIDLNFGCPVKKVVKDLVGAALMRDEAHAAKIFEAVVKAVKLPVALKMRMGWSPEHLNAPRLAKIAEESASGRTLSLARACISLARRGMPLNTRSRRHRDVLLLQSRDGHLQTLSGNQS